MGICISAICSDGKIDKVAEIERKEGSKEIEETSVVEINSNCPTSTGSWEPNCHGGIFQC